MELASSQSTGHALHSRCNAQRQEIAKLKGEAVASEQSNDAVTDDLRTQVFAQQINIEHLAEIAVAQKETTDATTEHLQTQIDSIQQEVQVLSQTVASQGATISDVQTESAPEELRQAYTQYLKAAADDLGGQYRQEQATHAQTQQKLSEIAGIVEDAIRGTSSVLSRQNKR